MKFSFNLNLVLAFLFSCLLRAQVPQVNQEQSTGSTSNWYLSLGLNVVDDSGNKGEDLFDVSQAWNFVPYPSRFGIGRRFENGLDIEMAATYNRYKKGKVIDFIEAAKSVPYIALDARLTYSVSQIFGSSGWFDPYVGAGFGFASANEVGRGTFNGVLGFRTWFSDSFALDLNTVGKWALGGSALATNHLQHAVGIVFQIRKSKKQPEEGSTVIEKENSPNLLDRFN